MAMRNPPKTFNVDIIITGNVAWNEDLSWETKLFYGLVRGHCRNDFYCCYASNEYLAYLLKFSERSVRRMISELEKAGVVFRAKGYVTSEEGDIFFAQRLIVPTDLKRQFDKAQDVMLDLKSNIKKNARRVDKFGHPGVDTGVHLNKKDIPCKNNKNNISKQDRNKPPTPLQGGEAAVELETPQFLAFGKEQNVRLTREERRLLDEEFGCETASSLVEQLSAYIKSGVKRMRKNIDHYAVLRDWGLRRNEKAALKIVKNAKFFGGRIPEHIYTQEELDSLYTDLDEEE